MFIKPNFHGPNKKIEIEKISEYFYLIIKELKEPVGTSQSRCL